MSSLMKKAGLIFDEHKTKPFLKMSITRLNLLVNKKANHIKITKKEISRLLADGKEEKARIKVEQVIREDFTIEAYDILELHCELVAERMRLVASQKDVPPDMDQAISTLIWAADRAEVAELSTVKAQFQKKYGYEFVRAAELNEGGCVNPKVVEKLDCQPPSAFVITEYLLGIAEEYGVDYTPAVAVRRKSSEAPIPPMPQAAFETPSHYQPPPGYNGGGGGGGGGSGISSPPPVTAWSIPSDSIPEATVKLPPQDFSHAEGGGGGAGGGGSAGGGGAGMPNRYPANEMGAGGYQESSGVGAIPGGGFDAAVKGWDPSESGGGVGRGGDGGGGGGAGRAFDDDTPPPPYSRTPSGYDHNDIPSPPHTRPVIYDIPAAPGHEDPPVKKTETDTDTGGTSPPASSSGQNEMDELAARFKSLRK